MERAIRGGRLQRKFEDQIHLKLCARSSELLYLDKEEWQRDGAIDLI